LLAGALNTLAIRFAEAGRYEQALPPAREAVTIYRRLAKADPDGHLPDLAGALSSLAPTWPIRIVVSRRWPPPRKPSTTTAIFPRPDPIDTTRTQGLRQRC
jgi:hypothetical protein